MRLLEELKDAAKEGGATERLVYTDWLEERGSPLGEVLRTLVEYQETSTKEAFLTMLQVAHRTFAERTPEGQKTWLADYEYENAGALPADEYVWELEDYPTDILIYWVMFPIMSLSSGLDIYTRLKIAIEHYATFKLPDPQYVTTAYGGNWEPDLRWWEAGSLPLRLLHSAEEHWNTDNWELREQTAQILTQAAQGILAGAQPLIEDLSSSELQVNIVWQRMIQLVGLMHAVAASHTKDFDPTEIMRRDHTQLHQELGSFWLCTVDVTQQAIEASYAPRFLESFDYLNPDLLGAVSVDVIEHYVGFREGADIPVDLKKKLEEFDPYEHEDD